MALVLVVFFLCSFSSKAELLTPGETSVEETVTEHLGEGHIDTVTKTTTIIENQTTGDLLDSNTGVVATRYEGDMDQDWGGIGSASMRLKDITTTNYNGNLDR